MRRMGIIITLIIGLLLVANSKAALQHDQNDFTTICVSHDSLIYHGHYTVIIILDGVQMDIPPNIGINDGCMNPIHTHDASGKVHVEFGEDYYGPIPSVGDFFDVWGETLSDNELLGETRTMTLTHSGIICNSGIRDYVPNADEEITISGDTSSPTSTVICPVTDEMIGTPGAGQNTETENENSEPETTYPALALNASYTLYCFIVIPMIVFLRKFR